MAGQSPEELYQQAIKAGYGRAVHAAAFGGTDGEQGLEEWFKKHPDLAKQRELIAQQDRIHLEGLAQKVNELFPKAHVLLVPVRGKKSS